LTRKGPLDMSTKSILINFAGYPDSLRALFPDNGLANLAASLIAKGHRTTILDYATVDIIKKLFPHPYKNKLHTVIKKDTGQKDNSSNLILSSDLDDQINRWQRRKVREIAQEINAYVRESKIGFVGLKLWIGEGFKGSIIIAEELKRENPQLPIFAGGPHVDWFKELIFRATDAFDVLVYGEGEETITMLADYVEGKRTLTDIPNLIYRSNGKIVTTPNKWISDLNNLPIPTYDENVYPAMKDNQKIKVAVIDESRGCPYSCNFCIHPIKSGNKWRKKSIQTIIAEIKRMSYRYGFQAFVFAGSNPPPALMTDIAKELIKQNLNITYSSFGHARSASIESFHLLKESGCHSLFFGIESGSQKILDRVMNKKVKVKQSKKAVEICKRAGIYTIGSVIIPSPGETEETKQETLKLLLEIKPDSVLVTAPALIRGTQWAKNSRKYGFDIPDLEKFFEGVMSYQIKTIYPPDLWDPFPDFSLDNKSSMEIMKETAAFAQLLEENGILTQVVSGTVLIAKYTGMSPKEFRYRGRQYLSTGNHQEIAELVVTINERIVRI